MKYARLRNILRGLKFRSRLLKTAHVFRHKATDTVVMLPHEEGSKTVPQVTIVSVRRLLSERGIVSLKKWGRLVLMRSARPKVNPHNQFFSTDLYTGWVPIDHFFYAPLELDKQSQKPKETRMVAYLETHASVVRESGFAVTVTHSKDKSEEFEDVPSALRRMADIIEEHEKLNDVSDRPVARRVHHSK